MDYEYSKYFFQDTSTTAAVMFFFFAISCSWILVNVMLTIIIEGFAKVKVELQGKGNELEIIEYIKGVTRSMGGLQAKPTFLHEFAKEPRKPIVVDKEKKEEKPQQKDHPIYSELPDKMEMFLQVR